MKITSPTLAAFFFSISTVHAGCYTSGAKFWGGYCYDRVYRICDFLSGPYTPHQTKYHCYNLPVPTTMFYGQSIDFRIYNGQSADGYVNHDSCVQLLSSECGCSQGGISSYYGGPTGDWTFQSDPQGGFCNSDSDP